MCSDLTREPLPGTAKTGGLILALEYPQGWGRDILDGEALGKELAGDISRWLKQNRAQLQFIRRPGRAGQIDRGSATLFIANAAATEPTLERMEIAGVEALTGVDLSSPGDTPGAERVDHPLLLVCTHGKRDRCCAVKGRPLAAALAEEFAAHPDMVRESSHTKGHRFAPSMILLPWNYSFGTLNAVDATSVLQDAAAGRLPVVGNRGRGTLGQQEQVAELAVAEELAGDGESVGLSELVVQQAECPDTTADTASDEDSDTDTDTAAAAAADYAAVGGAVSDDLRRRAGELITQRIEMKITGRYGELKELKRQGYFQPVEDFEQALKTAASERGVYGKYSKYNPRRKHDKHDKHDKHSTPTYRVSQGERAWIVTLARISGYSVVSSCGDGVKQGSGWVADRVSLLDDVDHRTSGGGQ